MANVKISELTAAASVTGTQEFEINDSGTSKKVTGSQIATYVESEVSSSPSFTGQASFADGTAALPSITNTGDTNTGIFFPAADTIAFAEGGSERMRIDASGNVGIGTSSPSALLQVDGGEFRQAQYLNSVNYLTYTANGSQAAPTAISAATTLYNNTARAYDGTAYRDVTSIRSLSDGAITSTSSPGFLSFRTTPSGTISLVERMRIASNGNVGIGTSSPDSLFHVAGGNPLFENFAANPVLYIRRAEGTIAAPTQITASSIIAAQSFEGLDNASIYRNVAQIRATSDGAITSASSPGFLTFRTTPSGSVSLEERMRITSDGLVGIGTSSPSSTLSVGGNISIQEDTTADRFLKIGVGRTGNGNSFIDLVGDATYTSYGLRIIRGNTGANTSSLIAHRGTGNFTILAQDAGSLLFQTNSANRLTIDSTGVVTIANLAGTGTRTVTATATGVLAAASDSRLKQEVPEASIAGLAEIMQLRPVAYKWLDDIANRGDDAAVELGFFADEAKNIIPSAAPMGNDGYYGFYDRAVIAALTKAVQEQQAIITSLEARLTAANL